MSNRKETQIVLGSKRYQGSIDTDLLINVTLDGTQKEIDEFDRNVIVNLAQVFDDERQASSIFRPSAEIDFIFYNAYSGTTSLGNLNYSPFTNILYYVNAENSFGSINWSGYPQYFEFDLIRVDNNVSGYTVNSGSTPPHVAFINKSASTYNWTEYISYGFENDYSKTLQYYRGQGNTVTWQSGNGIPFYIVNPYFMNGRSLISFVCPVEHNLTEGEFVELDITGWNGYNGNKVFQVYSLGNEGYNSEKFIFNIFNNGFTGTSFSNSSEGTFKRIIDINNSAETKSIYYVRKNKIITNVGDSILTNAGFEQNIFNNKRQYEYSSLTPDTTAKITKKEGCQSYLLSFSKDIDISLYRDNLNRPITELFFTIINRGYFGWFNKPLNPTIPGYPALRQGYSYNLEYSVSPYWSVLNESVNKTSIPTNSYTKTLNGNQFQFYYNECLKSGDTIDGDYCEFNQFEQEERIISELFHKFVYNNDLFVIDYIYNANPVNLINIIPNPEGYYYQPHHRIPLSVYSTYLEEGSIKDVYGSPDYSYYSNYKNSLIWRDIYTYGFIDDEGYGLDYPFANGAHYPSTKIIFRVFPEGNIAENTTTISQPITDDCE
jgi:hypothetical protein